MKDSNMTWGGSRSGAGRPRADYVAVTIYISHETNNEISRLASDLGMSKGKVVDLLVRWYDEDCRKEK